VLVGELSLHSAVQRIGANHEHAKANTPICCWARQRRSGVPA